MQVVEVDMSPPDRFLLSWYIARYTSSHYRELRAELETLGALQRRIAAVRFTAVAYSSQASKVHQTAAQAQDAL